MCSVALILLINFGSLYSTVSDRLQSRGNQTPRGGALNFYQVGVCGPDFRSVGLANWYLPLKRGLVNWKFPNFGAVELKISKFGGLWAKLWVKIEAVEAKISKFSQNGVLWTDSSAWNGTLANCRRGVKRGSSGPHIPMAPYPLSRSVPPPESDPTKTN